MNEKDAKVIEGIILKAAEEVAKEVNVEGANDVIFITDVGTDIKQIIQGAQNYLVRDIFKDATLTLIAKLAEEAVKYQQALERILSELESVRQPHETGLMINFWLDQKITELKKVLE